MTDVDQLRRDLIARGVPQEELEKVIEHGGQVWDTTQLREDFEVVGFAAPVVVVRRKLDGKLGSLMFTHRPRFYFGWVED